MIPLVDHLRALLGNNSLAADAPLLVAADARAAKLPREYGVLHSQAVENAIRELAASDTCACENTRVAYYLGLQVGWRVAQRLR